MTQERTPAEIYEERRRERQAPIPESVKEEIKPHEETEHEKKIRLLNEEVEEHKAQTARDEALGERKSPAKLAEWDAHIQQREAKVQEGETKMNEREAKVTERELAVNARIQEVNAWITSTKGEVEAYVAQRKAAGDAYERDCKKKGDDDVKDAEREETVIKQEAEAIRADALKARWLISQKDTKVLNKEALEASAEFKELEEVFKSYLPSPQRYRGRVVHPDTYDTEQGGVATDSVLLPISYEKRLIAWQLRYPEYYEWACGKHKTPVARLKELEKKNPQLIKNIAAIAVALEKGVNPLDIKRKLEETARARKR